MWFNIDEHRFLIERFNISIKNDEDIKNIQILNIINKI